MASRRPTENAAADGATKLPVLSGGAWEVIIDKAVLEVTNYLSATVRPFDPTGPLSRHMLALLDRSTLLDIMKERNYNRLCGRPGCAELPSGLQGGAAARDIDFSRWRSTSLRDDDGDIDAHRLPHAMEAGGGEERSGDSDSDASSFSSSLSDPNGEATTNGERRERRRQQGRKTARSNRDALRELAAMGEEAVDNGSNHMVKEGNMHLSAAGDAGGDVIEYADDVFIEETFRLAEREQRLLRQLQRKQQARQEKAKLRGQQRAKPVTAPATGGKSGMLGATMEERFCTTLCLEAFQDELLPLVPLHFEYSHEELLDAVSSLFPNLRAETLRQLAGLEAGRTALVKDVVEKQRATAAPTSPELRPVTIGSSNESEVTRHTAQVAVPALAGGVQASRDVVADLAAATAAQMGRRDTLWDAAVVYRLGLDVFRRANSSDNGGSGGATHKREVAPTEAEERGAAADSGTAPLSAFLRPLKGPLLVTDFLLNMSSNTTKRLFLLHFCHHQRNGSMPRPRRGGDTPEETPSSSSSVWARLVEPVRKALAQKADELQVKCGGADVFAELLSREDDLHVDPQLQQQRRELVISQLFSADLAAALSRLAWVDVSVIQEAAWEGVWFRATDALLRPPAAGGAPISKQHAYMASSLVNSLVFPFAVPSVLMRPIAVTGTTAPPEVVALGLVLLLASSLCHVGVRAALLESEEALEEVLFAVGMSDSDVTAALRALVLSEED